MIEWDMENIYKYMRKLLVRQVEDFETNVFIIGFEMYIVNAVLQSDKVKLKGQFSI